MKKKLKIVAYVLAVFVLLNSALLLVLYTYQDEIFEKVKKEIAVNFTSDIKIEEAKISPFKNFPKIAVVLKDIQIKEDPAFGNQNLASIDRIYLFMNPFTFFKKNYVVDKVEFSKANVFVRIDSTGQVNYNIWKQSKSKSEDYTLEIKKILVNDCKLSYLDNSLNQELVADITEVDFKGLFTEKQFRVDANAKAFLHSFRIGNTTYVENDKLSIQAAIQVNTVENSYTIESTSVELDDIAFDFTGNVLAENDSTFLVDLESTAKGIALEKLLVFIPDSNQIVLEKYTAEGIFDFSANISGLMSKEQNPHIEIDFTITDGIITNNETNAALTDMSLHGKHNNGDQNSAKTSSLILSKLHASLNNRKQFANFNITNFNDAHIQGGFQNDVNLSDLNSFYPFDNFKNLNGNLFIKAEVNSKLSNLTKDIRALEFINAEIVLDKINIQYDSSKYKLEDVNGIVTLNKEEVLFQNMKGIFTDIAFDIDGSLNSLFSYLYDQNSKLTGKLKLVTSAFRLDELLENEHSNSNDSLHLPSNIDIKLDLLCNGLIYENFVTERIRGWISIEDKRIMLDRLNLNVAQGLVSMKGMIEETPDAQFSFDAAARLNKIDINDVLILFNNFKQDYITHEHLYGQVNGQVQFSSIWDQNLNLDLDKLFVLSDVVVDHGNLKNFKPLIDLMGFVKMKKMKDIEFDRLENSILIKDRTITIPNMDIRNSAFTMSLAGTHNFDDEIDYHFKINLTDLFFKRHQQMLHDFKDAETDNKGGLNLYVHMFGTADKTNYRMDRKAVKENMNANLKDEKEEFFDLFRKKKKIVVEEELEFEWEDEK